MADYVVPEGWKFDGASQDGNQTSFLLPNSTVAEPNLALFSRTRPVVETGTHNVTTKARFTIRRIVNQHDSESGVRRQAIVETTVRFDPFMDVEPIKTAIGQVGGMLSDVELQSDIVDELYLPR